MKRVAYFLLTAAILALGVQGHSWHQRQEAVCQIKSFYPDVDEVTLDNKEIARRMSWVKAKVAMETSFQRAHTSKGVLLLTREQMPPKHIQELVDKRMRFYDAKVAFWKFQKHAQYLMRSMILPYAWAACDAQTVWMLHCNGADASTTFTDSSTSAKTQTARDNAQIDTAQSKLGGASGLVDGTGDWVDTPYSTDFDFGSGDYSMELFIRFNSVGECGLISNANGTTGGFSMNYDGSSLVWRYSTTETTRTQSFSSATWYHVAIDESSGTARFYVDGTTVGTTFTPADPPNSSSPNGVMRVGTGFRNSGGSWSTQIYFNGWFDEVRISKGVARWAGNFTAPSTEYCASTASYSTDTLMGCC